MVKNTEGASYPGRLFNYEAEVSFFPSLRTRRFCKGRADARMNCQEKEMQLLCLRRQYLRIAEYYQTVRIHWGLFKLKISFVTFQSTEVYVLYLYHSHIKFVISVRWAFLVLDSTDNRGGYEPYLLVMNLGNIPLYIL